MKIVLDTCVLYPTVMRQVILGAAEAGAFTPVWSARILEEWSRAAIKLGPQGQVQADAEITQTRVRFPQAEALVPDGLAARLWLPDANDVHVLAVAVCTSSDAIMTLNAKDFPRGVLAEEGVGRIDPDTYLFGLWKAEPEMMTSVTQRVLQDARALSGSDRQMRALLKKARLPRLAKALS